MRIKNSKSQKTWWFPVDEEIRKILIEWIEELLDLGCTGADALFPPDRSLASTKLLERSLRVAIEPCDSEARVQAYLSGSRHRLLQSALREALSGVDPRRFLQDIGTAARMVAKPGA